MEHPGRWLAVFAQVMWPEVRKRFELVIRHAKFFAAILAELPGAINIAWAPLRD